jgi:hypothetical protein
MLLKFYDIANISHAKAIKLMECAYDGGTIEKIKDNVEKLSGGSFTLKRVKCPNDFLDKREIVLSTDSVKDRGDHVVILQKTAKERNKVLWYVLDPAIWKVGWRNASDFKRRREKFYKVCKKIKRKRNLQ